MIMMLKSFAVEAVLELATDTNIGCPVFLCSGPRGSHVVCTPG